MVGVGVGEVVHLVLCFPQNPVYQLLTRAGNSRTKERTEGLCLSCLICWSCKRPPTLLQLCRRALVSKGLHCQVLCPPLTSLQFPKCSAGWTNRRTSAVWEVWWGGASRFPLPVLPPPSPAVSFFGALSVFSEHEVEGILTLYCSLTWGEGGQIWRARVGGDWGGDSFWGEKRQTTFLQP